MMERFRRSQDRQMSEKVKGNFRDGKSYESTCHWMDSHLDEIKAQYLGVLAPHQILN